MPPVVWVILASDQSDSLAITLRNILKSMDEVNTLECPTESRTTDTSKGLFPSTAATTPSTTRKDTIYSAVTVISCLILPSVQMVSITSTSTVGPIPTGTTRIEGALSDATIVLLG